MEFYTITSEAMMMMYNQKTGHTNTQYILYILPGSQKKKKKNIHHQKRDR